MTGCFGLDGEFGQTHQVLGPKFQHSLSVLADEQVRDQTEHASDERDDAPE